MAKKDFFRFILRSEQGQTTVEYILLLAVVISLFSLVFRSNAFQNLLGEDGSFFQGIAGKMEYSYRNGLPGNDRFTNPNYSNQATVPTYYNNGETRFFSAKDPYPN